ncbi:hypothetical protein BaRGS_00011637, partial [Batillaria attramentaria]
SAAGCRHGPLTCAPPPPFSSSPLTRSGEAFSGPLPRKPTSRLTSTQLCRQPGEEATGGHSPGAMLTGDKTYHPLSALRVYLGYLPDTVDTLQSNTWALLSAWAELDSSSGLRNAKPGRGEDGSSPWRTGKHDIKEATVIHRPLTRTSVRVTRAYGLIQKETVAKYHLSDAFGQRRQTGDNPNTPTHKRNRCLLPNVGDRHEMLRGSQDRSITSYWQLSLAPSGHVKSRDATFRI